MVQSAYQDMMWLDDAANAVSTLSTYNYLRDPDQPANIDMHQIEKLTFPVYAAVREQSLSTIQNADQLYLFIFNRGGLELFNDFINLHRTILSLKWHEYRNKVGIEMRFQNAYPEVQMGLPQGAVSTCSSS